jgi:formylglycine-generating enzyme required for sulfatase activity
MGLKQTIIDARLRWEQSVKNNSSLGEEWAAIRNGLLGDKEMIQNVVSSIETSKWDDAICSLFQYQDSVLKLSPESRATFQYETVASIYQLSANSNPGSSLNQFYSSGTLETFLLRLGTKIGFSSLTPTSKKSLLNCVERMVWVQGGEYWIGSNSRESEKPLHTIKVKPFQIGVYPVTQALWAKVSSKNSSKYKGISRPVESISWFDAVWFCNMLSKKSGLEPCYVLTKNKKGNVISAEYIADTEGYRLPTEAEWEIAAGASHNESNDGPISSKMDGWFSQTTGTRPVGQKSPNSRGLFDSCGNVFEWCWDYYGPYEEIVKYDDKKSCYSRREFALTGIDEGRYRVYRGGCWNLSEDYNSTSGRMGNLPSLKSSSVGFRVAKHSAN